MHINFDTVLKNVDDTVIRSEINGPDFTLKLAAIASLNLIPTAEEKELTLEDMVARGKLIDKIKSNAEDFSLTEATLIANQIHKNYKQYIYIVYQCNNLLQGSSV